MGRNKKKKAQNIQTKLLARSTAQLEKALEGFMDIPDPEQAKPFDPEDWAGDSPEHIINGTPNKDLVGEEKEEDENTE